MRRNLLVAAALAASFGTTPKRAGKTSSAAYPTTKKASRERFFFRVDGNRCVFGEHIPKPFACTPKGWDGQVAMEAGKPAVVSWYETFRSLQDSITVKREHYIQHDQGKGFWLVGPPKRKE